MSKHTKSTKFKNNRLAPISREESRQQLPVIDYYTIELKAYQIYQQRGGDALSNWLEAERLLIEENKTR